MTIGVLYRSSIYIQTPNYPSNYVDNDYRETTISVSSGSALKIDIDAFSLENHSSCGYDWLEFIPLNPTSTSSIIVVRNQESNSLSNSFFSYKYCGDQSYARRLTAGDSFRIYKVRSVKVVFRTDGSGHYSGFQLKYYYW